VSRANRVETMAEKLMVYARRAGVDDVALVVDSYWAAMQPRLDHFSDVFHHDMLHPARTALILIEQAGCRSSNLVAAGEFTETLIEAVRLPANIVRSTSEEVWQTVRAVPNPLDHEDNLVELLVTAEPGVALVAVAERLDHARHLHMRDRSTWRSFFEQTRSVYLPVAQRVDHDLFQRFERWANSFQRRLA
jgi:(p)ppGpp synthase/HD superfamily hydrolase